MTNRWKIPPSMEREITERDKSCVYCQVSFAELDAPRRARRSWEHIVNDARIVTSANIALCCIGCNASKGAKDLDLWFVSAYCLRHGISGHSVAPVVKRAIVRRPCLLDVEA